jgi:hypothetical protein
MRVWRVKVKKRERIGEVWEARPNKISSPVEAKKVESVFGRREYCTFVY